MPARIISWWLATSASAGASLRVEMRNLEAFMGRGSSGWRDMALGSNPLMGQTVCA
jgi:hypothetical protein